jgi:hypothetical protein
MDAGLRFREVGASILARERVISRDKWAAWVLSLSHANDGEQKRRSLKFLVPIRD